MTKKFKNPKSVTGPPVVFISVKDNSGIVGNTSRSTQRLKPFLIDLISHKGILQIL
jgi:hypothetical protein